MSPQEMLLAPFAYMPPGRLVDGLTAAQAAQRVPGTPHTIVEILAHLVFWQNWFLERMTGRPVPMASTAAQGWPAADQAAWEGLRAGFLDGLERAVALAETPQAASARVEPAIEFPPLAEYTVGAVITHVAMHNAHHLGQVVTLRQMIGAWPPPDGSWTW
jgi:uncharacterized damage-inducible protein DinB